ncbi:MAG: sigma-54 dependent transcriptional regulator [Polyangiaceae bacterium]|jgi:DNA-binding NtrC family response regulator|nr:sigma-54 dependent transcriptional regulator [Polyangiaceae bacterium]
MSDRRAAPAAAATVLYVDDEEPNLELFRLHFEDEFPLVTARSAAEALATLRGQAVGLLLTDERMPGMSGIELLAQVAAEWPEVRRVIVSAYADADRLLRAINRGHAHEYVLKPWSATEMRTCIERSLVMVERRRRLAVDAELADVLAAERRAEHDPGRIVGEDGGLAATVVAARRAARSDATVLLRGETGTGKELFARLIHECSARATGPFVRVNCAALAEGLLESELFGHEKGSFTGAVRQRRGRFELAHRGTLFLDEIGDVSPKLQASLLRVLQERTLERVGGDRTVAVDVRVVAATHRDLEALSQGGSFRSDLFYRLNVIPIFVPPLRDRRQDLPALVEHLIAKYHPLGPPPRVSAEALAALARYAWPGNVRELENLVQRALVLAQGGTLDVDDFCLRLEPPAAPGLREQARDREAEQLREVFLHHGGNCARAARALGLPRTTFLSRAKKHGLL